MGTTGAVVYVKPYATAAGKVRHKTGAVMYFSPRVVTGAYAPGIASTSAGNDAWLPQSQYPLGHVVINGQRFPVQVDIQAWYKFFQSLSERLGGVSGDRLPDVVATVETAQASASQSARAAATVAQQTQSAAESIAVAREVIQAAGLPGADQIPPPVLGGGTAIP